MGLFRCAEETLRAAAGAPPAARRRARKAGRQSGRQGIGKAGALPAAGRVGLPRICVRTHTGPGTGTGTIPAPGPRAHTHPSARWARWRPAPPARPPRRTPCHARAAGAVRAARRLPLRRWRRWRRRRRRRGGGGRGRLRGRGGSCERCRRAWTGGRFCLYGFLGLRFARSQRGRVAAARSTAYSAARVPGRLPVPSTAPSVPNACTC